MQPWLDTFRKPDVPPVADLAQRIVKASLGNAEALKVSIQAGDEKDRMLRWFALVCEFLYFFMHMANRFAYGELGHERRCRMQDRLYPLIVRPTIESVFGHWPVSLKDKMEGEFIEKLGIAETEYGRCKKLLDSDNPFAGDALFSKFAGNICELLGTDSSELTDYAQTYMKVRGLATSSFKELGLLETVRAVGKEL
ncbi:MAG: hypothetical protein WA789_05865 [Candidatus Acidiferrum sp.]